MEIKTTSAFLPIYDQNQSPRQDKKLNSVVKHVPSLPYSLSLLLAFRYSNPKRDGVGFYSFGEEGEKHRVNAFCMWAVLRG